MSDLRQRVEAIREQVGRSLAPALVEEMRETGVSLTLGTSDAPMPGSTRAAFLPVAISTSLADELAERELVEEMVSYRKNVTGVDNTVFISPRGNTQHSAQIKLAIDPADSINPGVKTASIAIHDGSVAAGGPISAKLLDQARRFIDLNRAVLIDYWEYHADTDELRQRLRSI
jgi:NAD(P)H-dependent FMN reductase